MRTPLTKWRHSAGLATGAVVLTATAACSPGTVPAEDVANEAATMLEQEVGQAPDDVTCEEDLPAEVDASIQCELTSAGETYGVTITTTSAEGGEVQFDVEVDEQPAA